ncbi:hypothetical protein BS78_K322400 [Paspalum vaginatum]|uniref:Uncharacterized protein n=1 Tax=Paspalum vaginatum TaxID=158149 RepID=A0A9W7XDN3_9POAL|nr:hypothetical protein BS78_K322400 [Paspalum vaginatum]
MESGESSTVIKYLSNESHITAEEKHIYKFIKDDYTNKICMHNNIPYEYLIPRMSFKTNQMLSFFTQDIKILILDKYAERHQKVFYNLQEYFMNIHQGTYIHQGLSVDTCAFPSLQTDKRLAIQDHQCFVIFKALLDLKTFRNIHTHAIENISLQKYKERSKKYISLISE